MPFFVFPLPPPFPLSSRSCAVRVGAQTNTEPDGFFDAGMLLQALKARGEHPGGQAETKPSERAAVQARRRGDIGKKLRLIDY